MSKRIRIIGLIIVVLLIIVIWQLIAHRPAGPTNTLQWKRGD